MKNIDLVVPKINEYSYKQKLENDPLTMNYNDGYDVGGLQLDSKIPLGDLRSLYFDAWCRACTW